MKVLLTLEENSSQIEIKLFPVRYFTRKLELVSDILWVTVDHFLRTAGNIPIISLQPSSTNTLKIRCNVIFPDNSGKFLLKTPQELSQPVFTCLKLTTEALEQGVKNVQS